MQLTVVVTDMLQSLQSVALQWELSSDAQMLREEFIDRFSRLYYVLCVKFKMLCERDATGLYCHLKPH